MARNPDAVVVLKTDRDDLVLRGGPTNKEVRAFVTEHDRRYSAGEPGGPDQSFARRIESATRYSSELDYLTDEKGRAVKIEDIIKR